MEEQKTQKKWIMTEEQKEKIRQSRIGRKHSPETLLKISLAKKGKPSWNKGLKGFGAGEKNSMYGVEPWNKGKKGLQKHSEESLTKIREARKNQLNTPEKSPEVRAKLSAALKGRTFEEIYGPEEAARQKELRKQKLKGHPVNDKTREAVRKNRATQKFPFKDSSSELLMQDLLKQLGIEFVAHYFVHEIDNKYRCDLYIPSTKTIIECDGDYWHANPERYPEDKLTPYQIKQRARDALRTKQLIEHGFRVIRIWESEIKQLSLNELNTLINQYEPATN